MRDIQIYSGTCCLTDIGAPTGQEDFNGHALHVGDIVQIWHGNYIGTDFEEWHPSDGLTAIVRSQYQSYTSGNIELLPEPWGIFTMGIAGVGIQGGDWRVKLVKSHDMIVSGERFMAYGLNFKEATAQVREARRAADIKQKGEAP